MYRWLLLIGFQFFFLAEDGIRVHCVTGVQTCALPICNVGVSEAVKRSADVVIILNQDTKVGAHTLARMASFLEEQKHPLTVAAPLLYEYASDLLYPPFVKGELSQNPKLVTDAMAGRLQAAYQVTSISACCLAFKATLFEQLGLFDPHFRHYSEDLYFFDYLHRAGGQAFIISQTKVQHYNSYDQATGQERVRILLLQRNGHALFRKKTGQTYLAFAIRSYAKALLKGYVSSIPQMLRYDWWLFIHRRAISRNSPADIRARIHQWMARDLSV